MNSKNLEPAVSKLETTDSLRQAGGDWWLVWNPLIVIVGTCAVFHWFHLDADGEMLPLIQIIIDIYSYQVTMLRAALMKLPLIYVSAWFLDYIILGLLFSLLSIRAIGPKGPGQDWPASGKLSDWAFHFTLWPLILLFYVTSIFHIVELVDRERLSSVRSTLLSFLLIAPLTSLLVLIRDLGLYWTTIN